MSLHLLDATTLRKLLKQKEISAQDISDALLAHIKKVDGAIHAFEYLDKDVVAKQLQHIDKYAHEPLYGIPVGVKDIFNTSDMPTQMGSPIWKDFTPGNDARVVHYIRESGGIILGKTVTAEFAVHYQSKTLNPHDTTRSPGTSSSGSAAAVAAYMVPIALGSQTAGSIARPASYCGVYGFKPSFGAIARIGVLKTSDTLDNIGFLTRSIDDLKLIFDVTRSKGENYEYTHKYFDNATIAPKKYRVAIISEHPKSHYLDPYSKKQFDKWTQKLQDKNIELEYISLPKSFENIYDLHATIYEKSLAYYFKKEFEEKTLLSPVIKDMITRGNKIDAQEYHNAVAKQAKLTSQMSEEFKDYDILITPTTSHVAPIGLDSKLDLPDSNLIWTFLGMPTVSAPLLKGSENMPQGVLFVAKKYDDLLLLDFLNYLQNSEIIPKENYE